MKSESVLKLEVKVLINPLVNLILSKVVTLTHFLNTDYFNSKSSLIVLLTKETIKPLEFLFIPRNDINRI